MNFVGFLGYHLPAKSTYAHPENSADYRNEIFEMCPRWRYKWLGKFTRGARVVAYLESILHEKRAFGEYHPLLIYAHLTANAKVNSCPACMEYFGFSTVFLELRNRA